MSFQYPLTTAQYVKLRRQAGSPRSYGGARVISLFPSSVVLHGTIDTDLTGPGSWATFEYTTLTGDYLDTRTGQEIFISTTADDINTARIIGRVRELGDADTLYPNESSERVPAGSFFWVCDNHVPQYRLSRSSTLDPAANPEELLDYNQYYLKEPPVIVGLRTAYVGDVNANGKFRFAVDLSQPTNPSYAAESGATIASVIWVIDNATYIAGSSTTMRIVVDVDPGHQWAQCQLTDSEGTFWIRYFKISAHDASNPPFIYGDGGTISGSLEQGWMFTLPAFANVDDVLVNDFAVCWRRREVYNNTQTTLWGGSSATITNKVLSSNIATLTATNTFEAGQQVIVVGVDSTFDGTYIVTASSGTTFTYQKTAANVGSTSATGTAMVNLNNVDFVGWLGSESDALKGDAQYSVQTGANFEFMSIGARMARLWTEQLSFEDNDAPTKNGQIVNLNPWRAIWHLLSRYTTVADVCEVNFSNHADTDFLFPVIPVPEETVQSAINAPAAQINAIPSYAPWGPIAINRQVAYLSTGERGALTTAGSFEAQDLLEAPRTFSALPDVSKVDAVGLFVNTGSGVISLPAPQSRAPGYAPGEAAGTETLDNQILQPQPDFATALTELELRAGSDLNFKNTKVFLDCTFPDGYVACQFTPSRDQLYTFTLTAVGGPNGVNRIEYTTADKWTVDTVSVGHDQRLGRFVVRVRFRLVSPIGDAGDDTTNYYVAPGTTVDPLPDLGFPAFNFEFPEVLFPDVGLLPSQVAPAQLLPPKGKALKLDGSEILVWSTTRVFYERNVIALTTPTAIEITPPDLGSFIIQQCVVATNPTPYAAGAYLLAYDGTDSAVWYNPNIAAPFASMNWTKGTAYTGHYTVIRVTKTPHAIMMYTPGTGSGASFDYDDDFSTGSHGWSVITYGTYSGTRWDSVATGGGVGNNQQLSITKPISGTVTQIDIYYTTGQGAGSPTPGTRLLQPGGSLNTGTGTFHDTFTPGLAGSAVNAFLDTAGGGTPPLGNYISRIRTQGVASTGNAKVRYSTNDGSTFGAEVDVSLPPTGFMGGFDIQRAGTVSYAAAAGKVYKATTLGGTYSLWYTVPSSGNPTCIIIPYYKRNSSVINTSTSTPDALIGCDDGTWSWIDGVAATATDIEPTNNLLCDNPNAITTRYGKNIALFGDLTGTYKVYESVNAGGAYTLVKSGGSPTFIRSRRNDTRPAGSPAKGQLFLADTDLYYSSKWGSVGVFVRNQPVTIIGFDCIW